MPMETYITVSNLSKAYGNHVLFNKAKVTISNNQKIGLVGRNGAGKTTFIRILTNEETPDSGEVILHPGVSIGYLKQQDSFFEDESVLNYILRISNQPEWKCGKAAYRFGLTSDFLDRQISSLSGGYQMRVKLAAMIAKEPNLILLDEPTNYLDLATTILLEEFIKDFKGSIIVISHDREFIKRTCDHTLEIEHGVMNLFPRPLEEYLEYKAQTAETIERYNAKVEKTREHLQKFVDRFRAKASKATQAQSKIKQIEKLGTIEIKNPLPTIEINLPKTLQSKGMALRINDMDVGYEDKTIAKGLTVEIDKGEHIAILGNNGQGKSTLMKTIADKLKPTRGAYRWTPNQSIGYFGSELIESMKLSDNVLTYLRRQAGTGVNHENIMRMASNFLFDETTHEKKVEVLSGGEKSRLALAGLLLTKYDVILLDEPTNHLDFETVEALALALAESDRTVIFISHDRTFVSVVADRLIHISSGKITEYLGSYDEYVQELINQAKEFNSQAIQKKISVKKPQSDSNLPELKKQLKEVETEIAILQKDKQKLLNYFQNNPGEFNLGKTQKLKVIETELKEKEAIWSNLIDQIGV